MSDIQSARSYSSKPPERAKGLKHTSATTRARQEAEELRAALNELALRKLPGRVPTTPGFYRDNAGEPWMLAVNGHWYDQNGDTRPQSWNPLLLTINLRKAD